MQTIRWFLTGTTLGARRARLWFKIILMLALFVGLFWVVPIEKVAIALLSADLRFFFAGWIITFISIVLNALELLPLMRKQNLQHKLGEVFVINLAVKFYSLFMPGSIVGSGLRWYRLAQPGGKTAEALAALAFFRILETFLSISFGLSFLVLSDQDLQGVNNGWFLALAVGIILVWLLITRWSFPIYNWFKERVAWLWQRAVLRWFFRAVEKTLVAVTAFADMSVQGLAVSIIAGIASLSIGVISNWLVAQAVGIDLPIMVMGWIYVVIILATQFPFAFAGGLGIREVTLVAIMPSMGISMEQTLAFSFMLFIRGALTGLVGGLIEAGNIFWKKHRPEAETAPVVREI